MKRSCSHCTGGHFRRRDFLRVGALSFLGLNLPQFLRVKQLLAADDAVDKAKAKACILVWLDGGPSQMDTFDPKENSTFGFTSTNVPGIQISASLPKLAQRMDKLALIRSMHTEENVHTEGMHFAATGHRPNPAMKFPCFGAVISNELGSRGSMPRNIMVPAMPKGKLCEVFFKGHIISPENDPLVIPDPNKRTPGKLLAVGDDLREYEMADLSLPKGLDPQRIENRKAMLELVDQQFRSRVETEPFKKTDAFLKQAFRMITTSEVRNAFDLSQEPQQLKETYGRDSVGQTLLLARRLVEAGARFVTAGGYGEQAWDTHDDNDKKHRDVLAPTLDRSLSALVDDLANRGLLESTVVVVMGEFGRTADINVGRGRDHWPECWTAVLAGGGIQGGAVVGASDERGAYVADRMVSMGDLFATIYKAMGIDWTKEYMHPVGRPVKIANSFDDTTGIPIQEII